MEYDGISPRLERDLERLNTTLAALFALEVGAKVCIVVLRSNSSYLAWRVPRDPAVRWYMLHLFDK